MDRRRFLFGSAVGASLLAGWTQADLTRAQSTAEAMNNDDTMPDGGTPQQVGEDAPSIPDKTGLVTIESTDSFEATLTRITNTIENNPNLTLITTVDHAANAESVGMELPPTTLLVFGNPRLGTPLMQRERTIGIDLPQKMLVWQEGKTVNVTYNDPFYLADRHGITDAETLLTKIATALRKIATGPDRGENDADDDGDGAVDEDDEPDDGDDGADDFNGTAEDDDDRDGAVDEDDEPDSGNSDDVDNDGDGAVDEDDEPDTGD